MVSNMQGLTALVRSTFSKAFWYRVGDLSRISCSQWMHGRAIHLAASYYDAMDEYGRPKKVNRIEERRVLMEEYNFERLDKVPGRNKRLPNHLRRTEKQKLRVYVAQYIGFMVEQTRIHQLEKAMDVLRKFNKGEMKAPSNSVMHNVMITGYGKHGMPNQAFKIYNQMKKRGLKPTDRTFTSLFNAFASAPVPSSQLERVYNLQKVMEANENVANSITYNALIQALVNCEAKVDEPFEVHETMKMKNLETDSYTYCYLLKACSKDKKNGITKALKVWEEMHLNNVPNNIYSYNMLLQALRDCDIPPDRTDIESKIDILGGLETFFDKFSKEKIKPNITTFDLLSYVIPYQQIGDLIKLTIAHKVTLDVAFMNSLLRRQVMEGQHSRAKNLFKILLTSGVEPNQKTYQILASCCNCKSSAIKLLKDMTLSGLQPNNYVYSTLLKTGINNYDYPLITAVMKFMNNNDAIPNDVVIDVIQKSLRKSLKSSSSKSARQFPEFYASWNKIVRSKRERSNKEEIV